MEDITGPKIIEIQIRRDGKVVWVIVDGKCVFRACQIDKLIIRDYRPKKKVKK